MSFVSHYCCLKCSNNLQLNNNDKKVKLYRQLNSYNACAVVQESNNECKIHRCWKEIWLKGAAGYRGNVPKLLTAQAKLPVDLNGLTTLLFTVRILTTAAQTCPLQAKPPVFYLSVNAPSCSFGKQSFVVLNKKWVMVFCNALEMQERMIDWYGWSCTVVVSSALCR